jgi:hypothetical protein
MTSRRLVVALAMFALGMVLAISGAIGLTYWIDPAHERYNPQLLARAAAAPQPCAITADLIGDSPAIASFKLDVARSRRPSLVVLGLSRSLEIRAWPGEKGFANLGTPGLGPAALLTIVERLHALGLGPETVYLDVEPAWFNRAWSPFVDFNQSLEYKLRRYVSSRDILASVRFIAEHPGANPGSFVAIEQDGRCVLRRRGQPVGYPLWDPDGSIEWSTEGRIPRTDFVTTERNGLVGMTAIDPGRVAELARAVDRMHALGWRVIGFTPPLARWVLADVARNPRARALVAAFREQARAVLARNGYPYVDLIAQPGRLGCAEADFVQDDGTHPNAACSARIRSLLDRVASSGSQAAQSTASGG